MKKLNKYKLSDESLEKMRDDFAKIYAVTDEKFKSQNLMKKLKYKTKLLGYEVGHIFYFSDKYSKPMNCLIDDKDGKKTLVKMIPWIGVSRLVGAWLRQIIKMMRMKGLKSLCCLIL